MTDERRFRTSLSDLEASARVASEDQREEQPASPPLDALDPEDADRIQLLNNPAGAGRLRHR